MPHGDRPRADELDVDVAVVHKLQMALLGVVQLLVGHFKLTTGRILRDRFCEKLAKRRGRGHMAVNVNDFVSVVHVASVVCWFLVFGSWVPFNERLETRN